jgi:molybdopterin/thiamine biosynthesis adenylyltransferase
VTGEPEYLQTYEGQVAALVGCNLLSRMTPSVALWLPDVAISEPLPWRGESLRERALKTMRDADAGAQFECRTPEAGDIVLHIGPGGADYIVHGTGWDAWIGTGPSPLKAAPVPNPFGAGLAAILAVARMFVHELDAPPGSFSFNALNWCEGAAPADAPAPNLKALGNLWFAGVGSVGSAVAYFLGLATRDFSASLFDMDQVNIQNLDRSPIFGAADADAQREKVEATGNWLRSVGVNVVTTVPCALHEAPEWLGRQAGNPDVLISAANELNVRNFIEEAFPPVQLYATTGKNWQVALIRHIPLKDPCSLCLFPNTSAQPATTCATGAMPKKTPAGEEQMDAALPFLSFAAGLMTAAEITKLSHPSFPYSENGIYLHTRPEPAIVPVCLSFREGCLCETRSRNVHRKMISGSRYQRLSD